MAKANPTSGASLVGTTVGGLRWTVGAPDGPTITLARPVNNLRSISPAYKNMNTLVETLDANYKLLPPPTQAQWVTSSGLYAGLPVCGCALDSINGQKLYRLVNFVLTLLPLPLVSLPPGPPSPRPDAGPIKFLWFRTSHIIQFSDSAPAWSRSYIAQCGQGLSNPLWTMLPFAPVAQWVPPNPIYILLAAAFSRSKTGTLSVCQWDDQQAPVAVDQVLIDFA